MKNEVAEKLLSLIAHVRCEEIKEVTKAEIDESWPSSDSMSCTVELQSGVSLRISATFPKKKQ